MPNSFTRPNGSIFQILVVLTMLVIIIAGLRAASEIISPLLMSLFVSVIAASFINFFIDKGVPKTFAWLVVVVFAVGVVGLMGYLVNNSIQEFHAKVPEYVIKLDKIIDNEADVMGLDEKNDTKYLKRAYDPIYLLKHSTVAVSHLGNILRDSFFVALMVVFMLARRKAFVHKVKYITRKEDGYESFKKVIKHIDQYALILSGFSALTGITVYIVLEFLNIEFALMWALAAFFLNFIPNIGSVIAAIPPVLIALIDHDPMHAGLVALAFFFINTVYGNILMPRFLGKGLGLSIVVVFLSLIFWGWVFGPIGMFLSVPLTVMIKIIMEENEETRWIAVALGDDPYLKDRSLGEKIEESIEGMVSSNDTKS